MSSPLDSTSGQDPGCVMDLGLRVMLREAEEALFGGADEADDAACALAPWPMLGRYEVRRRLGSGAMGTVFEAYDPRLDRSVALKWLHAELSADRQQRLRREALVLAQLSHPHVIEVYDVGHADGHAFIAMELVRGRTLACWQEEPPPRSWRECVRLYVQAGEGLAAAHAAGIVHRDFKPSNCMLGDDGRVRVLDFGLAKALDVDENGASPAPGSMTPQAASPSRTSGFMGTPAYVPLEQLRGGSVDARADQYAFCVSLYEIHPRGSQPRDTTRLLAETLGILRGCPLVRSGRESTWVDGIRHRSSKTLLDRTARDRGRASVATRGPVATPAGCAAFTLPP